MYNTYNYQYYEEYQYLFDVDIWFNIQFTKSSFERYILLERPFKTKILNKAHIVTTFTQNPHPHKHPKIQNKPKTHN